MHIMHFLSVFNKTERKIPKHDKDSENKFILNIKQGAEMETTVGLKAKKMTQNPGIYNKQIINEPRENKCRGGGNG